MPNESQQKEFLQALETELGGPIKQAEGAVIRRALASARMREFIGDQKAFADEEAARQFAMQEAFDEMNVMGNKVEVMAQRDAKLPFQSRGKINVTSESAKVKMQQDLEQLKEKPSMVPKVDKEQRATEQEKKENEAQKSEEELMEEQQRQQQVYRQKQQEQDQREQEAARQQEQTAVSYATSSVKKNPLKKVGAYVAGGAGVAIAFGAPILITLLLNSATKSAS